MSGFSFSAATKSGVAILALAAVSACVPAAQSQTQNSARAPQMAMASQSVLETQSLRPFDEISTVAGARVTYYESDEFRIEMLNDDALKYDIRQRGDNLYVDCKSRRCWHNNEGEFAVYGHGLKEAAVTGGGAFMLMPGAAPGQRFKAKIRGGGVIDIAEGEFEQIEAKVVGGGRIFTGPAQHTETSVTGGGRIEAGESQELYANISGGGLVTYAGSPKLKMDIAGGGRVESRD